MTGTALTSIPLVNLHTHLEGSLRPRTFLELCRRQQIPIPVAENEIEDYLSVSGSEQSLADYLAKIAHVYPVLRSVEALERAAYEAAEDAHHGGVAYLELRAGPRIHATDAMPVRDVVGAITHGLRQAERDFGMVTGFIVCAMREHPPEYNVELAGIAGEFTDQGVVGFDLAGDEARYPAGPHAAAFRRAAAAGLGLTCHAGEAAGASSVVDAVQLLGASRIGHGTHLGDDPQRVQWAIERDLVLEMCPISNVDTNAVPSLAQHPVRRLFDAGVRISIGDDDPATSRTSVRRELEQLAQVHGFTFDEIVSLQRVGLQSAFAPRARIRPILERLG